VLTHVCFYGESVTEKSLSERATACAICVSTEGEYPVQIAMTLLSAPIRYVVGYAPKSKASEKLKRVSPDGSAHGEILIPVDVRNAAVSLRN